MQNSNILRHFQDGINGKWGSERYELLHTILHLTWRHVVMTYGTQPWQPQDHNILILVEEKANTDGRDGYMQPRDDQHQHADE